MFGSKPAFGSPATTTSTFGAGSSLFGQQKSVFGQPAQQQTSSLFGQKPTGTSLFGQPTTSTSGGLFGSPSTTNTATSTGLFGAQKPSLFGASTGNTSFGQTSTSLFGNANTTAAAGSSMFGTAASVPTGTTIKFEPPIGQDTMQKNGTNQSISTKHMCITAMKQYEAKNLEELRVDDYLANRKAPTATSGGLFGASTATTGGLFGSCTTQQKSLFGSTAAPTLPTFGQPAAATTSLFGQKPAGSLFGTSTTSTFGQPAAPATTSLFGQSTTTAAPTFGATTTGTSLFGQPAATSQPSTFAFGAAPATSTASAFGGFGTATSTAATTSLFGKPATTSGFSFGATTAAPAFGQPAPATTSLFGPKPATTGFGVPATGTSLFGTQPAAATTSLFGAQPAAAVPAFGQAAAPVAVQQVAAPVELVTNVSQAQIEMVLVNAQLASSPFGDSPIFGVKKTEKKDTEDQPDPISAQRQKKFLAGRKAVTPSPISGSTPLRNGTAKNKQPNGQSPLVTRDLQYTSSVNPPTLGKGIRCTTPAMHNSTLNKSGNHSLLKDGLDTSIEASLRGGSNRFLGVTGNKNLKHLDASALSEAFANSPANNTGRHRDADELPPMDRRTGETPILGALDESATDGARAREATLRTRQPPALNLDTTTDTLPSSPRNPATSPLSTDADRENGAVSPSRPTPRTPDRPLKEVPGTGVRLSAPDYNTTPSFEAMREMVHDGTVILTDGLTIHRPTFGSVWWPGRIELKDVVLDEVVIFRHKEVTVYPDESVKPELGRGLNRPAEVTLERVWPIDKQTKQEIKDAVTLVDMGWRERLEKTTLKMDANFKDFRPQSGSWVFRVKHFSKYGLPDDSDEEDGVASSMKENALQGQVQRVRLSKAPEGDLPPQGGLLMPRQSTSITASAVIEMETAEEESMARAAQSIMELGMGGIHGSPTYAARRLGVSPHEGRPLIMEGVVAAPHYGQGDFDGMPSDEWRDSVPRKQMKMEPLDVIDVYEEATRMMESFRPRPVQHRVVLVEKEPIRSFSSHLPSTSPDCLRHPQKTGQSEMTAFMGTTSRVGWAAGGMAASSLLPGQSSIRLAVTQFPEDYSEEYVSDMFEHNIRLSHTLTRTRSSSARARHCEVEAMPSAPRVKPTHDYAQLIHSFLSTANQSDRSREALLWELCECLFPADRGTRCSWEWERREAVGRWIKKALPSVSDEVGGAGRGAAVWQLLCRGELELAIDEAIDQNLTILASLLAVFTVEPELTQLEFKKQITDWSRSGAIAKISHPLLKCYLTMAGLSHFKDNKVDINCLEGLDWLKTLGLRVWYSRFATTLEECIVWMEGEAKAGRVVLPPLNQHLELIRVAVDRTRNIERVLDATIEESPSHNDYHLAWHLWSVTKAAALPQMDESSEQTLHSSYASQLQAMNLPHLALFALAHISNAQCRTLAMRAVLEQSAIRGKDVDYDKAVVLCKIPGEWVAWAKYLAAKEERDTLHECIFALEAGELSLAHDLFMTSVAPDLFVSNHIEYLDALCHKFEEYSDRIQGWGARGQLYSEYIALKKLLEGADEDDNHDADRGAEGMEEDETAREERIRELSQSMTQKLWMDEKSTPIEQLAMQTLGRWMVEVERKLSWRLPEEVPLNAKSILELAAHEAIVPMDD